VVTWAAVIPVGLTLVDTWKAVASAFVDICIVVCGVGSVTETRGTGTQFMESW
jgi:hypothetical protein